MTRKQTIYEFLRKMKSLHGMEAIYSTEEIAGAVGASRANVSSDLNRLFEEHMVEKIPGWPIRYRASTALLTPMPVAEMSRDALNKAEEVFTGFVGYNGSMSTAIEKAKAAILYPLNGLPLLIRGKTGVGKTTFAKLLYEYARRAGRIKQEAKFVSFNCADYSSNPQLIMAQLFGCAKGAYTGAEEEKTGLVETADGGVLFLDEVHRLPDTAQEMLFFLMDFSQYRRLGEADTIRSAHPIIIMATTEDTDSVLLATFNRRIPISVTLPTLAERSSFERFRLIEQLFKHEATKLKLDVQVDALTVKALLAYACPGNVGQLENDIRVACARSYVECLMGHSSSLQIGICDFAFHVKDGLRRIESVYSDENLIATSLDIRIQQESPLNSVSEELVFSQQGTDIYDTLEKQYRSYERDIQDSSLLELAMRLDMEGYIQHLMENHDGHDAYKMQLLSQQAIDVTQKTDNLIQCELNKSLDEKGRLIVAMHLDTAITRIKAQKRIVCPVQESIKKEHPAIYDVARQVVLYMRTEYELNMPDDEIGLLGNLLIRLVEDDGHIRSKLLVVCQGLGSAKTMAKLADAIVGKSFVKWLDITDKADESAQLVALSATLDEMEGGNNCLVLTDTTGLLSLCNRMAKEREIQLYAIDNISSSMVVEAAMLMVERRASAQKVYHHLKSMERSYGKLFEVEVAKHVNAEKKRAIISACISGCGAAVRLKRIIEDRFLLPDDIEIITMDISSVADMKERVFELSAGYEVLCIVGMDVGLDVPYPFISIEEFVLGDGIEHLAAILERNHACVRKCIKEESRSVGEMEDMFYSGRYLNAYLFYLDADKMMPYLRESIDNLVKVRGEMREEKRIMLATHLCAMVERLMFDKAQTAADSLNTSDIAEALIPLTSTYHVSLNKEECDMIEDILKLVLD